MIVIQHAIQQQLLKIKIFHKANKLELMPKDFLPK